MLLTRALALSESQFVHENIGLVVAYRASLKLPQPLNNCFARFFFFKDNDVELIYYTFCGNEQVNLACT